MRSKFCPTGVLALAAQAFGEEFDTKGPLFPLERQGVLGIVGIQGPLLEHPNLEWDDYDSIHTRSQAAFAEPDVQAVALRINSPGGAAAGCIELARAIRKMSEETRKPVACFVDGLAASAGYAIASCANAGIYAPPTSTVGSMAVYKTQVDQVALDKAMGIRFEFIVSEGADLKLAGNPHIPLTAEVREHEQEKVERMTDLFYALVEEMRGLSRAQSKALRGAALLASQGIEKGLVDSLKTYGEFVSLLQTPQGRRISAMPPKTPITAQAKAASDDEWKALRTLAESDDEAKRSMARKMLKTMMGEEEGGGEGGGEGGDKEKKDKEAAAKAEDDKKKEEEAKAAKAKDEEAAAKALAEQGALALAKELQVVKAEGAETARKLAAAEKTASDATAKAASDAKRASLIAQRPDFSKAQIATLAMVSLEAVEDAVKNWPRVHASARASVTAEQTPATRGRTAPAGAGIGLTDAQQGVLDRLKKRGRAGAPIHHADGSLELSIVDPEAAAARLEQLEAEAAAAGD